MDIAYGLDFINSLRPVQFRMKTGDGRIDFGFIAPMVKAIQEQQAIIETQKEEIRAQREELSVQRNEVKILQERLSRIEKLLTADVHQ